MKVYVCWTVPDYIGIDIEAIFSKEDDAKKFCDEFNKGKPHYEQCRYEEYEVK